MSEGVLRADLDAVRGDFGAVDVVIFSTISSENTR